MEENNLIPIEKKDKISFNNMWAFDDILSIDLDNPEYKNIEKTNILTPILIDIIPDFLQRLGKDDTFRLVFKPEGVDLYKYSDGTYGGVYRKGGEIIEHTRWEKIGINFTDIIKNFANVAMNMYIASKVNEIEIIAKKILEGQFLDRLSEIESAINAYRLLNDEQKRDMKIMNENNHKLLTGIKKLEHQLEQELIDLYPKKKMSDNWGNDKNENNNEKFNKINFIVNYIIYAYRVLIGWNSDLNNNQEAIKMFNNFINNCKWDKIYEFAAGTSPEKYKDKEANLCLYSRCEDYETLIKIKKEIEGDKKRDFINLIEYKQVEFTGKKQFLEEVFE